MNLWVKQLQICFVFRLILTWKQYFGISVTLSSFTQILISVGLSWFLCFVLTATGVFTDDPNGWGYGARTDIKTDVLTKTSWFRFPYPGIIVFCCAISQLFSYDAYQTFFLFAHTNGYYVSRTTLLTMQGQFRVNFLTFLFLIVIRCILTQRHAGFEKLILNWYF